VYKPFLIALFSAGALTQAQSRAASPEADLVLWNGRILTVFRGIDPRLSYS
jgi:hypothetical protein